MPGKETSSVGELLVVELQPAAVGNRKTVKEFYKALASNDTETISRVVASDLEWWFHGPPHCQHMMRALTGDQSKPLEPFRFKPRNITAFADRVIVERWLQSNHNDDDDADDDDIQAYWVHVWTLKDGIMTQLRNYFDTWLTVIVWVPICEDDDHDHEDHEIVRLWQSEPKERCDRSLPDVVLPI